MEVTTQNGRFHNVARFVEERLAEFDCSRVDWFKLGETRINPYSGHCTYPKRVAPRSRSFTHGYRIVASVHPASVRYPWTEDVRIGTIQRPDISHGMFEWISERIEYADADEALVAVAGHEAFHFLRHSKQVPGQNTEAQANRFGLEWLKRWREDR